MKDARAKFFNDFETTFSAAQLQLDLLRKASVPDLFACTLTGASVTK